METQRASLSPKILSCFRKELLLVWLSFHLIIGIFFFCCEAGTCTTPFASTPKLNNNSNFYLKYYRSDFIYYSNPIVMDVVGDPHPEIFVVSSTGTEACSPADLYGDLRALHLVNGQLQDLWTLSLPSLHIGSIGHIAIAKVPNSNNEAIICGHTTQNQLLCVDARNGIVLFAQNTTNDYCNFFIVRFSALAIEKLSRSSDDLFILVTDAVFKYNPQQHSVSLFCDMSSDTNPAWMLMPHAADLDGDGQAELLYQNCVYSSINCSQLWCGYYPPPTFGFTTAIANMDDDSYAEIVMVGGMFVAVYDHDGHQKWNASISPPMAAGGPPTVADIDGDSIPDVGVSNGPTYFVLSGKDGSTLKTLTVTEESGITSSASFDFDNDNVPEIIYCDFLVHCYVIGLNWTLLLPSGTHTSSDNVVVVDLDLDGAADIIAPYIDSHMGVWSFNESVAGTRPTWTQHAYNSMNIDNLGYPQLTTATSTFRSNAVTFIRAEIESVESSPINCSVVVVTTRNIGSVPIRPSALCVNSSVGVSICNNDSFILSGASFVAEFTIDTKYNGIWVWFTISSNIISSCIEDSHTRSLLICGTSTTPSQMTTAHVTVSKSSPTKTLKSTTTPSPSSSPHNLMKRPCVGCKANDKTIEFTKENSQKDIKVPFESGKYIVGQMIIQANTFKPGCVLRINQSDADVQVQKSDALDCEPELRLSSIAVELSLTGSSEECKEEGFKHPVSIELYSKTFDTSRVCVAFQRHESSWKCLESPSIRRHPNYIAVKSETEHFTSFAVLLEMSDPCDRWIWIASLSLVGACLICTFCTSFLYCRSGRFRSFVGGFTAPRVTEVIENVTQHHT
eukprot:TRINITY_DN12933_c0_g1_i1.p1 TRINITY_DN12933_c0_g1~~TRINITY_DN12933_c0_g1_i1.p1  ORF type:complete len:845 (+),score=154.32 TRINITY_DN12933_c0_g1_i1:64-2598(+)